MRWLRYLRRRAALLDELETLRTENARLREDLETAQLWSWVRRKPSPKALLLPDQKPASKRTEPHPVQFGRHHRAEQAEIAPRRQR